MSDLGSRYIYRGPLLNYFLCQIFSTNRFKGPASLMEPRICCPEAPRTDSLKPAPLLGLAVLKASGQLGQIRLFDRFSLEKRPRGRLSALLLNVCVLALVFSVGPMSRRNRS